MVWLKLAQPELKLRYKKFRLLDPIRSDPGRHDRGRRAIRAAFYVYPSGTRRSVTGIEAIVCLSLWSNALLVSKVRRLDILEFDIKLTEEIMAHLCYSHLEANVQNLDCMHSTLYKTVSWMYEIVTVKSAKLKPRFVF